MAAPSATPLEAVRRDGLVGTADMGRAVHGPEIEPAPAEPGDADRLAVRDASHDMLRRGRSFTRRVRAFADHALEGLRPPTAVVTYGRSAVNGTLSGSGSRAPTQLGPAPGESFPSARSFDDIARDPHQTRELLRQIEAGERDVDEL